MNLDHHERIVRTMRLIRSIDGWQDRSLLREWHQSLCQEAEEIQRRHIARAIQRRSHPASNGLVAQYATMSGRPRTHRNPYERRSQSNYLP